MPQPREIETFEALFAAAHALSVGSLPADEQDLVASTQADNPIPHLRGAILDAQDPLGETLSRLRSAETRRGLGAIYTPTAIVSAMLDWAARADDHPVRVVDPGCGSGRFLLAAARAFPDAELVGVEIDPQARLLARANLSVAGALDRTRLATEDYRKIELEEVEGPTLFIGNPPYVRHHDIERDWKQWLTGAADSLSLKASQLAGLHVHFLMATALLARPGDFGTFVTSAEWLDVNYGQLARDLLVDHLGLRSISVVAPESSPFENATTTAAVFTFNVPDAPESISLRQVEPNASLAPLESGQPVAAARLREANRWTPLLRTAKPAPEGYVQLGELFRVHRGAVTGANRIWVVDPDETELPPDVLFRSVTRARELFAAGPCLNESGALRAVVDLPSDLSLFDSSERKLINRFLRAAKRAGTHEGYVARHRKAWWSVGLREPAPILATYMARRPPAFVRNLADARHINIAHGLYPREPLSEKALRRTVKVLSEETTLTSGRVYAGGLVKFEPREMERLLIPETIASA